MVDASRAAGWSSASASGTRPAIRGVRRPPRGASRRFEEASEDHREAPGPTSASPTRAVLGVQRRSDLSRGPCSEPHPPIWVAGQSPEIDAGPGRHGFNIMTVAHPFPPEHSRASPPGASGLVEAGHDPAGPLQDSPARLGGRERRARPRGCRGSDHPLRHSRPRRSAAGLAARRATTTCRACSPGPQRLRQPGRVHSRHREHPRNYEFDIFSATFNFGGIPHEETCARCACSRRGHARLQGRGRCLPTGRRSNALKAAISRACASLRDSPAPAGVTAGMSPAIRAAAKAFSGRAFVYRAVTRYDVTGA